MRYIIYIDKLLMFIFIFHILQLVIAKKLLLCTATQRRVLISAGIGTGLFYVVFVLLSGTILYRISIGCIVSSMVVIPICFWQGSRIRCIKIYVLSANAVFVVLSCLESIICQKNQLMSSVAFMQVFILFYLLLNHRIGYRNKEIDSKRNLIKVTLPGKGKMITVLALLDSGNSLYEPLSAVPVQLIGRQLANEMEDMFCPNSYRVVPYQSVGCKRGYLDSYRIPFMIIHLELEDRKIYEPVIAIAEQGLDENSRYQIILHPDIFIRRIDDSVKGGRERKCFRAIHWSK